MCKRKYNKFCFAYLCQPFKLHHRTSNWIRVFGSIERDNKLTYFMFIRFVARNVLHFVKREATLARESLFFTSSLTTYLCNLYQKISNGIWTNVASNWVNGRRKNGNFWDDWVVLSSAESGWVRLKGKLR